MNELTVQISQGELQSLPVGEYRCTLDPRERANRQRMATAVQTNVPSLMEAVNLEIDVAHLLVHRIDVVNPDTGEEKHLTRFVVFCVDGRMFSACGAKALKDVLLPHSLFGLSLPYSPPQRFRVRREKAKAGDGYYLALDWIDVEVQPKKGK